MADLFTLVDRMIRDRQFDTIARNPLAQFGTERRPLLGATLLPERLVNENSFTEEAIRYRSIIALGAGRYSPSQKRGEGLITGKVDVVLAEADIAREFTSRDYDALIRLLAQNNDIQAMVTLLDWVDMTVVRPLAEILELWRWQAITDSEVVVAGDNELEETVPFPDPVGHRAAAGGVWSNNAYDPMDDIIAMADLLVSKGYQPSRIVTSRTVSNLLLRNTNMIERFNGSNIVVTGGSVTAVPRTTRGTLADLNGYLAAEGLPAIETYDVTYNTETQSRRFMKEDAFHMFATTGRDESILTSETVDVLEDTLGYTAIGRAAGQSGPGRVIRVEPKTDKPPRVEAEGWETGLPVITEPEGITVITGIS